MKHVKGQGSFFAEAFMYRYHPKHRRIKEIIYSGEIGGIRGMHCTFTFNNTDQADNVRFNKSMGADLNTMWAYIPFR
ncbi:hypothetical protein [Paenibacillus sp. NPDC055715]